MSKFVSFGSIAATVIAFGKFEDFSENSSKLFLNMNYWYNGVMTNRKLNPGTKKVLGGKEGSSQRLKEKFEDILFRYTWILKHEYPITHICNEDQRIVKSYNRFLFTKWYFANFNLHPVFAKMLHKLTFDENILLLGESELNEQYWEHEATYAKFLSSLPEQYVSEEEKEFMNKVSLQILTQESGLR